MGVDPWTLSPGLARKNHALGRGYTLIASQKDFNRRRASIEEGIFDSVNRDKLFFELCFSKSSGTYRQCWEVPLPEPELITEFVQPQNSR
jgi:hypothetical protein